MTTGTPIRISQLPLLDTVDGLEDIPVVSGNRTKRMKVGQLLQNPPQPYVFPVHDDLTLSSDTPIGFSAIVTCDVNGPQNTYLNHSVSKVVDGHTYVYSTGGVLKPVGTDGNSAVHSIVTCFKDGVLHFSYVNDRSDTYGELLALGDGERLYSCYVSANTSNGNSALFIDVIDANLGTLIARKEVTQVDGGVDGVYCVDYIYNSLTVGFSCFKMVDGTVVERSVSVLEFNHDLNIVREKSFQTAIENPYRTIMMSRNDSGKRVYAATTEGSDGTDQYATIQWCDQDGTVTRTLKLSGVDTSDPFAEYNISAISGLVLTNNDEVYMTSMVGGAVIKIDADGQTQWVKTYESANTPRATRIDYTAVSVKRDAQDNIYLITSPKFTTLDVTSGNYVTNQTTNHCAVLKIDQNGQVLASKTFLDKRDDRIDNFWYSGYAGYLEINGDQMLITGYGAFSGCVISLPLSVLNQPSAWSSPLQIGTILVTAKEETRFAIQAVQAPQAATSDVQVNYLSGYDVWQSTTVQIYTVMQPVTATSEAAKHDVVTTSNLVFNGTEPTNPSQVLSSEGWKSITDLTGRIVAYCFKNNGDVRATNYKGADVIIFDAETPGSLSIQLPDATIEHQVVCFVSTANRDTLFFALNSVVKGNPTSMAAYESVEFMAVKTRGSGDLYWLRVR